MASSSSTPAPARSVVSPKLYDVFISHRGPDVKETLAKQLYDRLKARDCKAFLDREEIEGGDSIPFAIENGILSSRVQIAIFSKGYAESSWCLDELVLMLKQTDALFIPVFYGVQPWGLRYAENKTSQYAAAFSDYQRKGRNLEKLDEWKEALKSASYISGYELSHEKDNLCEKIVSRVVQVIQENINLHVAKYPVGLDELVQDFERGFSKTTGMVGIVGLGGTGKTTLSKELFNRKQSGYDASCFLSDVRESHARGELHRLQRQLLKDLLNRDKKIRSVDHGIGKLKHHFRRAKHLHFFIVLDDIDHQDQLDALLPEGMLGSGCMVIITTRDLSVLRGADFRYQMKEMNEDHARKLFCSHAFCGTDTPAAYEKLVESFVEYCEGLPLSLKVLGAHVYRRDENYWELELQKVNKIQPKDIIQSLKISFDGLDGEEKQIFIDIACLFNKIDFRDLRRKSIRSHNLKSKAIIIWNASGWSAEHALQTLQDKCLVEMDGESFYQRFQMHDRLRDVGRQMAKDLGPPRLSQSELLRSMEAKGLKQILAETKGRLFHSSLMDPSLGRVITFFLADNDLLWLQIEYYDTPEELPISIPSWIPLRKLHILDVWRVEELWSSFQQQSQINPQASFELRQLRIFLSPSLQNLPDLLEMFSHLEELEILDSLKETAATSLTQSIKRLSNLRSLLLCREEGGFFKGNFDLSKGTDPLNSSRSSRMDRLETIELRQLGDISKLVISGEMCPRLRSLLIFKMGNLKKMELNQLERLNTLQVDDCYDLEAIDGLSSLTGLQTLELERCAEFKYLPNLANLLRLEKIIIARCPKLQSVEGAEELPGLRSLLIGIRLDGYASWVRNYICGLKKFPVKKIMQIIFEQKEMGEVSSKLNANMFSEVVGTHEVSEIETREYLEDDMLQMRSSSSAITIYALIGTASLTSPGFLDFESERISRIKRGMESLITVVLTQHNIEGWLSCVRIKKGLKVTMKVGEEGKALTVLQTIADQLYPQNTVPNLVADQMDVIRSKKK